MYICLGRISARCCRRAELAKSDGDIQSGYVRTQGERYIEFSLISVNSPGGTYYTSKVFTWSDWIYMYVLLIAS